MAVAGRLRLRRTGHDTRVAQRTRRHRTALSKSPRSSSASPASLDAEKTMDSRPPRQPKTLSRCTRCWRGIFACGVLSAPARENRGGEKTSDHGAGRAFEGADLLLQHGLLRSAPWQRPRCADEFADQLQDGQLFSGPRQKRSGPESAPRRYLIKKARFQTTPPWPTLDGATAGSPRSSLRRKFHALRRARRRCLHLAKWQTGPRSAWRIPRQETREAVDARHDRPRLVGDQGSGQRMSASPFAGTRSRVKASRRRILARVCASGQKRNHHRAIALPPGWIVRARYAGGRARLFRGHRGLGKAGATLAARDRARLSRAHLRISPR